MLSSEEKKTLLKAIEEIKDKSVTVFEKFECKDVKESKNFADIFVEKVISANAIKNLERLLKRY